jgi:hypothetical protein
MFDPRDDARDRDGRSATSRSKCPVSRASRSRDSASSAVRRCLAEWSTDSRMRLRRIAGISLYRSDGRHQAPLGRTLVV